MHGRSRRNYPRSPKRVRTWYTQTSVTSSLAVAATANVDMLSLAVGTPTVGMTVIRTHLIITPLATPALGDRIIYGLIIGRVQDIADPATAGLTTPVSTELDWMLWSAAQAAPTFSPGGANQIVIDNKSKRRLSELSDRYMLSILNNQAAAQVYRIDARTLVMLP